MKKLSTAKAILIGALAALLVVAGVYFYMGHRTAKPNDVTVIDAGILLETVQDAKDLIVYKYHYESIGNYLKERTFFGTGIKVPFTQDRSIFAYRGTISAGVDLKDLSVSVDNQKQSIQVFLPHPAVLAHEFEIDSFRIYDLKDSVFTKTNLSDYAGMEKALKDLQESRLQDDEDFWSDVRANTELVLKDLFSMTGKIDGYSLEFVWVN